MSKLSFYVSFLSLYIFKCKTNLFLCEERKKEATWKNDFGRICHTEKEKYSCAYIFQNLCKAVVLEKEQSCNIL